MWCFLFASLIAIIIFSLYILHYSAIYIVKYIFFCSKYFFLSGPGKFEVTDIEPALEYCTHLIYGYAALNEESYKLTPLNEQFDVIKDNYRKVTDLKKRFPKLKVLLSVGGNADVSGEDEEKNIKYRNLVSNLLCYIKTFVIILLTFLVRDYNSTTCFCEFCVHSY